jgi:hypothetical protein
VLPSSCRGEFAVSFQQFSGACFCCRSWDEGADQALRAEVIVDVAEYDLAVVNPDLDLDLDAVLGKFCHLSSVLPIGVAWQAGEDPVSQRSGPPVNPRQADLLHRPEFRVLRRAFVILGRRSVRFGQLSLEFMPLGVEI